MRQRALCARGGDQGEEPGCTGAGDAARVPPLPLPPPRDRGPPHRDAGPAGSRALAADPAPAFADPSDVHGLRTPAASRVLDVHGLTTSPPASLGRSRPDHLPSRRSPNASGIRGARAKPKRAASPGGFPRGPPSSRHVMCEAHARKPLLRSRGRRRFMDWLRWLDSRMPGCFASYCRTFRTALACRAMPCQ